MARDVDALQVVRQPVAKPARRRLAAHFCRFGLHRLQAYSAGKMDYP